MNDKWKIAMKILDFLSQHGKEVNTGQYVQQSGDWSMAMPSWASPIVP